MRDRFHSDPVIEAAELLLQEKAPRDIPISTVRTEAAERGSGRCRREQPRYAAGPQPGAGAASHQCDVERPVFGDGDGDRHRLQPLRRHLRHPLAGRSDRGSDGHLPVPSRHRDAASGGRRRPSRRASRARPHRPISATTRQASSRRSARSGRRSNASSSPKGMAKAGASPSGTTATPTATSRSRRLPSWRWRPTTPTAPIRPSRRCSCETEIGADNSVIFARRRTRSSDEADHRAGAFRRGQLGLAARDRGRDRPPRLHRPRPLDRRSGGASSPAPG